MITHVRGRMLEESSYYPDGLKMAGICAKAYSKPLIKRGYQGDFSEEDEETGYNEFDLRMYDPQIGRWISTDPYDYFVSSYVAMGTNNNFSDFFILQTPFYLYIFYSFYHKMA